MRVAQFEQREDFLPVFTKTLARGWSIVQGQPMRVCSPARRGEQRWFLQPLLSACHVADPSPRVRAFLRDSIRFGTSLYRLPLQFAFGMGLTSRWGLSLAARPCFSVAPCVPSAGESLAVPGNLRVRIYDFRTERCLVLRKDGFASDAMRREIEARKRAAGLSLPIIEHAQDWSWFAEPIWDGFALPHIPPWLRGGGLVAELFRRLDRWAAPELRWEPVRPWLEQRLEQLHRIAERLPASMARAGVDACGFARALAVHATQMGEVPVAPTHGDLQAGNVLVRRDGRDFSIIDWEHAGERFSYYDRFVFALGARAGRIIVDRTRAFLDGASRSPALAGLPMERRWKRCAVAGFLLEDLLWFTDENLRGPFRSPSIGWMTRLALEKQLLSVLDIAN